MPPTHFYASRLFWKLLAVTALANSAIAVTLLILLPRFEPGADSLRLLTLLIPLAIAATLFLMLSIVGIVTRPLARLTHDAEQLAAGGRDLPYDIARNDEIGLLRRAFENIHRSSTSRMEELADSKDRLAAVLGSMNEGVIAVDHDDRVLFANEASGELLGMSQDDPRGRFLIDVARFIPISDAVRTARQTQLTQEGEFRLPRGGRVLSFRASPTQASPALDAMDDQDHIAGNVVVVLRDVTELRRLENMRSEFVANVSHELKTPLAAIQAYTETLQLGAIHDSDNNLMFLDRIEEQAERLHQLILDLLQLARIESAPDVYDITDINVVDSVQQAIADYKAGFEANEIEVVVENVADPLIAQADREGLRTVLDNLIGNAIKYTPRGGTVTVRTQHDDGDILIEVLDTGIGIPAEHQQRVFERFHRVDKARSRDQGGTGLGLSIVKHLVQVFGGSVGVESQPNRGSRFFVRLPAGSK